MKNSRGHHIWTDTENGKLAYAYPIGGVDAARRLLPHLSDSQITSRAKKLGLRAPTHTARFYARLSPLDPANDRPTTSDMRKVIRKGVGEWKAEVPAIRWVFDLGLLP